MASHAADAPDHTLCGVSDQSVGYAGNETADGETSRLNAREKKHASMYSNTAVMVQEEGRTRARNRGLAVASALGQI